MQLAWQVVCMPPKPPPPKPPPPRKPPAPAPVPASVPPSGVGMPLQHTSPLEQFDPLVHSIVVLLHIPLGTQDGIGSMGKPPPPRPPRAPPAPPNSPPSAPPAPPRLGL